MGSEMFTWASSAPSPAPEKMIMKPNFARTCNRFSQFLKERRSLGDAASLNRIASPKLEMNGLYFPGANGISGPTNTEISLLPSNVDMEPKSLDLFPLTSSSTTKSSEESTKNMADSRESPKLLEESKTTTASMTIFYGGKVLVFDELPEEKAQEIMSLASQGVINTQAQTPAQAQAAQAQAQVFQSNTVSAAHLTQGLSDLPIARRGSLLRFMEKRKDRIAASAPYQLHKSSMATDHSHSKKCNLVTNQEQHQLELKL